MDSNSTNVSKDLYNLILDRKANPVDGSYTNYLSMLQQNYALT